jgi:hypothetical protein
MNRAIGGRELAHARLSARYGQRPDEAAWRRIAHLRSLAAVLDTARSTSLDAWLAGIGPGSTPHEIEYALRCRWRAVVGEVANWAPEEWQRAVEWCAVLADLSSLQHLARGGVALPWMRNDAMLHTVCGGDTTTCSEPPKNGPFAAIGAAWSEPERIGALWLAEWRRRMPSATGGEGVCMNQLVQAVQRHFADVREPGLRESEPMRRALESRLVRLFRRAALEIAEVFVFLALVALDLERLRGELVRRAAFPTLSLVT